MITVTLHRISNADAKQAELARRAAVLLQEVVNHATFAEELASTTFSYVERRDGRNNPIDVMNAIRTGKELGTKADGEIDLIVELRDFRYWRTFPNHKTVGATDVGGPVILTSNFFMNTWTLNDDRASAAAHFMHEWMHVAGYCHQTTAGDQLDVAYAVGHLVEHIAHELLRERPQPALKAE